jgi:hypothetical protein
VKWAAGTDENRKIVAAKEDALVGFSRDAAATTLTWASGEGAPKHRGGRWLAIALRPW